VTPARCRVLLSGNGLSDIIGAMWRVAITIVVMLNLTLVCQGHVAHGQRTGVHLVFADDHPVDEAGLAAGHETGSDHDLGKPHDIVGSRVAEPPGPPEPGQCLATPAIQGHAEGPTVSNLGLALLNNHASDMDGWDALIAVPGGLRSQVSCRPDPPPPRS
jgi:hypothetical protein